MSIENLIKLFDVFEVAKNAHEGQKRKNGLPYITHPINVARIVKKYGGDETLIYAALLHDVVEDTPIALEEIERKFGKEVAFLVDGVTKTESKEETLKKVEEYSRKDKRVILLKLSDRLHNLQRPINAEEQKRVQDTFRRYYKESGVYIELGRELGYNELSDEVEKARLKLVEGIK